MTTETYTPTQELAGSEQPHYTLKTVATDQTLARLTPLGQVTATGELVAWAPAASDGSEKAVFLAAVATDTTSGAASKKVVKAGHFNSDAIAWPDGVTALQKATAFVGTPISHEPV